MNQKLDPDYYQLTMENYSSDLKQMLNMNGIAGVNFILDGRLFQGPLSKLRAQTLGWHIAHLRVRTHHALSFSFLNTLGSPGVGALLAWVMSTACLTVFRRLLVSVLRELEVDLFLLRLIFARFLFTDLFQDCAQVGPLLDFFSSRPWRAGVDVALCELLGVFPTSLVTQDGPCHWTRSSSCYLYKEKMRAK